MVRHSKKGVVYGRRTEIRERNLIDMERWEQTIRLPNCDRIRFVNEEGHLRIMLFKFSVRGITEIVVDQKGKICKSNSCEYHEPT